MLFLQHFESYKAPVKMGLWWFFSYNFPAVPWKHTFWPPLDEVALMEITMYVVKIMEK